jgi:hypothetical protein
MAEMAPVDRNKSRGGTNGWKQEQGVQQPRVVLIYMNIWSYFFNVLPNFTLKHFYFVKYTFKV